MLDTFMSSHRIQRNSLVDQVVTVIRSGIQNGRWKARMPGQARLAKELGVARETAAQAISRLISEGVLEQPAGRVATVIRKEVLEHNANTQARTLRVALLFADATESKIAASSAVIADLISSIQEHGHSCAKYALPAGKDIHKTGYLQGLVDTAAADAWLVYGGTLEVLTWFSQNVPHVMALGGRCTELPIAAAGSNVLPALSKQVKRLLALGHRRIVLICYRGARHPKPGQTVEVFRELLQSAGITAGDYHVPDWEETPAGLEKLLQSTFQITPPTALICWTLGSVNGVLGWLARNRVRIPQDVSVVSLGHDLATDWFQPNLQVVSVQTDDKIIGQSVIKWLNSVISGQAETQQTWCPILINQGNSIGPAPSQ